MGIHTIYNFFNKAADSIIESLSKVIEPKYQKILFVAAAIFSAIGAGYLVYQWRNKTLEVKNLEGRVKATPVPANNAIKQNETTPVQVNNVETGVQGLLKTINEQVLETLNNAKCFPGWKDTKDVERLRAELITSWKSLVEVRILRANCWSGQGDIFAGLRAVVGHVISTQLHKEIKSCVALIYMASPVEGLCVEETLLRDASSEPFMFPNNMLRDFIRNKGVVYVTYPKDGLLKRTAEEQAIYKKELEKAAAASNALYDRPMKGESVNENLVGTTYIIKDKNDQTYVFSSKIGVPKIDGPNFGLWFGKANDPIVKDRLEDVTHYLDENKQSPIDLPTI